MRDSLPWLLLLFFVVALLCLADQGEALSKKSRRRKSGVSSKESSYRHIESKIKNLERKFKKLSRKSCQDGAKGKDGDCNNICSQGYQLKFEGGESKTGRAACCKPDQVVTPTGACRPKDEAKIPSLCYRLRARLLNRPEGGQFDFFLRGFEGEIDGNIFRCNNDGCCSGPDSVAKVRSSFRKCGLSVTTNPNAAFLRELGVIGESCTLYNIREGSDSPRFNFDIANAKPYYGGIFVN